MRIPRLFGADQLAEGRRVRVSIRPKGGDAPRGASRGSPLSPAQARWGLPRAVAALSGAALGLGGAILHFHATGTDSRDMPIEQAAAAAAAAGLLAGGRALAPRLGRGSAAAAATGVWAAVAAVTGLSFAHGLRESIQALRWRRFADVESLLDFAVHASTQTLAAIAASPVAPPLALGALLTGVLCEALHRRAAAAARPETRPRR